MMNNGNPKGGYVQLPICDKSISSETAADFTLPDYQPEIKRLLRVSATVLPPSRYVGDRECEITGNIDYYVLYIGSDNAIYCAPLTGDYKISAPVEHPSGEESVAREPRYRSQRHCKRKGDGAEKDQYKVPFEGESSGLWRFSRGCG